MYRSAALFFVLAIVLPTFASAQTAPTAPAQPKCFLTSEKNPSGTKTFQIGAETEKEIKAYLTERIMCPSACFDEAVTMEFKKDSIVATIAATNMCRFGVIPSKAEAEHNNRGCANSQIKPVFTLKLIGSSAKAQPTKTRCDVATVQAALANATPEANKGVELRSIAQNAVTSADLSIPENRDKFRNILQAFGVSSEEAKDVVENRPDDAKALMQAFAAGDKEQIQAAAREAGVSLNEGTVNDFVNLKPEDQVKKFDTLYSQGDRANIDSMIAQNTFARTPPPGDVYIAPTGAPSAPLLPGNKINPAVLGSIAADAQRRVCAAVSGPCFVTPQAQFATMMNETNGNVRLYGDGGRSTSLAQVYQPTALGLLDKYRSVYGEEYVLHRTDIRNEEVNPEWIASQSLRMQALVIQDKATRTGGDFQRTVTAYNGGGPMAAAYGVRAIRNAVSLQSGGAPSYWQEAYNSTIAAAADGPQITNLAPAGALPAYAGYSGSPFGNVNPFSASQQSGRVVCTGTGYCYASQSGNTQPAPVGQPVQIAQPTQPAPVAPQPNPTQTVPATTTATIPPAVASFVVQPKEVMRGKEVKVSWSSVGMSTEMLCQVFAGTSFVAQGNEGSRAFDTASIRASTTVKFTLQCFSKTGAKVQKEENVQIK